MRMSPIFYLIIIQVQLKIIYTKQENLKLFYLKIWFTIGFCRSPLIILIIKVLNWKELFDNNDALQVKYGINIGSLKFRL